ncbi:MAG: UDP-N-acetylmuramoyl-L-alanyl-D-glutamate--2,6-diaminopimelate ligase, partial [Crocinitomicaceae bacterium]|nr:UDP-N-acetylmuramoyl-L-alanyl-D-glutamate--2,6-diaminopimelate ligase [Crocinitomicaceae bacterium]
MRIKDIIADCSVKHISGSVDLEVKAIVFDSRKAVEGTVFVAIKGTQVDGHQYISNVIEQGCKILVVHEDYKIEHAGVTLIGVEDTSLELGRMAASFYQHPSKQLKLVGITGTNGKTTCVTLLHKLFTKLGYKTGLLSTVVNKIGDKEIPSTHTTPDPVALNGLLADMVAEGCDYCFMEVSSHAVVQHRISGLNFIGAVFTNITHDHLDYHGTFKEYIKAKKQFF